MAGVPLGYRATLYDLANKRSLEVYLEGEAYRTDRQIGGGPMPGDPPFTGDPGYGKPPPTWGGGGQPYPPGGGGGGGPGDPPLGFWGPNDPRPSPPIYLPPEQTPPGMKPEEPPAPGSPTTIIPGEYTVNPVTPPAYITVNWPGIGPCRVAPPVAAPAPSPTARRG